MYCFADTFDCYATTADSVAGYWDSGTTGSWSLVAGRFTGSQAVSTGTPLATVLSKSSAVNDAVHHISLAFRQTAVLTGTTLGMYFQFIDNATNQCCIVFRSDGVVLLTSATPAGTTLATYSGAVTAQNTWFQFEFEVVISSTVGRFRARKNGNTSDDFDSGATLNTRPGTNAYANKLTIGNQTTLNSHQLDDFLWRSDASSVSFVGDIRGYARMPASDVSTQFSRAPGLVTAVSAGTTSGTNSKAANLGLMNSFVASYTGTVATAVISLGTGGTGNMKAAIYDATRTTVLGTSNAVVNPVSGSNTITFGTPVAVVKGATYWLAVDQDFTIVYTSTASNVGFSFTTTYASFPVASPVTAAAQATVFTVNITTTVNSEFVNEVQQDGTTSYVYDATTNDADLYSLASIGGVPSNVVAVTTRGFFSKSDAGARGAQVQLKSGATTATSTATLLSNTFGWLWRTDVTDPATGSAWTGAAVDALTIGPRVTS